MKKLFILLCTVLMLVGATGCSGGSGGDSGDNRTVITLDMSTLFIVPALEATKKVEDQINDYLLNTLHEDGYKIHLVITSIGDYFQKIPMELASGGDEAPDIVQVFDLGQDVRNGYLTSLDPYLDNELKPTVDLLASLNPKIIWAGEVGGETYAIPRFFGTVLDWKWIYNKTLVNDAGVDVSGVNSIEDLDAVLAELKTAYPEEHFLVYNDQFNMIYDYMNNVSQIGTFAATIGDDPTLVSYYETESYQQAIQKAYEYRQKGYSDPEGSQNTASHDEVVMSGSSKGVIMGHSADESGIASMFTTTNYYGAEFDAKTIEIGDLYTDTLGIGISHSCKDPAAAARFINLLYTDEYVWETLIYGAEGQDYVWNADHTKVNYPEGLDFYSVPYNCIYSCGMIGNGFQGLEYESGDESGSDYQYGYDLMKSAWEPPLYGFVPDTFNVMNEVAAVNLVVNQYTSVLQYGDVDPAVEYPKFIAALKDSGIDIIIADYQQQAQEWLKTHN